MESPDLADGSLSNAVVYQFEPRLQLVAQETQTKVSNIYRDRTT